MKFRPFRKGDTFETFRNLVEKTKGEINELENEYVLKASMTELEEYFLDKAIITIFRNFLLDFICLAATMRVSKLAGK